MGSLLAKFDFADQTKWFGQGLVSVALLSVLFAGLSLVMAALTPRRGFGVAAVIALLTITYGAYFHGPGHHLGDRSGRGRAVAGPLLRRSP
ncbi:hypothetical protein SBADM41S_00550 [Streptomyces badius]